MLVHPPSLPSLGWDVTSDLLLEVGMGERDSHVPLPFDPVVSRSLTCLIFLFSITR